MGFNHVAPRVSSGHFKCVVLRAVNRSLKPPKFEGAVPVAGRTYPKRLSAVSPFPLPVLNPRGVEVLVVRPYFRLFNWSALVISRRGKSQSLDRL